jgi:hypothetical protein
MTMMFNKYQSHQLCKRQLWIHIPTEDEELFPIFRYCTSRTVQNEAGHKQLLPFFFAQLANSNLTTPIPIHIDY